MFTDKLIYELFKRRPGDLLLLADLEGVGTYNNFESITVKTERREKRMDGLMMPKEDGDPVIFFEAQGQKDDAIYWRGVHEASAWIEKSSHPHQPFLIVFLFLKHSCDPGLPKSLVHWEQSDPPIIHRLYLSEVLHKLGNRAGGLVVLKPLVMDKKADLKGKLTAWQNELEALHLEESEKHFLVDLLLSAVMQRLPNEDIQEIERMIVLSPVEKSRAYQQLKARAEKEAQEYVTREYLPKLEKEVHERIEKEVHERIEKEYREKIEREYREKIEALEAEKRTLQTDRQTQGLKEVHIDTILKLQSLLGGSELTRAQLEQMDLDALRENQTSLLDQLDPC